MAQELANFARGNQKPVISPEIVPEPEIYTYFFEKNFRAIPKPASRAIAGLSMGGGHTWANWRLYLNTFARKLFK